MALKEIQKCLSQVKRLTWFFIVDVGWDQAEGSCAGFELPAGTKEGAPGFSYQLSQVWGRRGRRGSET